MRRKISGCGAWKASEIFALNIELVSSFKIFLDKSSKMRSGTLNIRFMNIEVTGDFFTVSPSEMIGMKVIVVD